MTLSIQTERALIRADAKSTRYILARVTAPRAEARATRLPVNLGLVVDRSGSMGGAHKFPVAYEAVRQATIDTVLILRPMSGCGSSKRGERGGVVRRPTHEGPVGVEAPMVRELAGCHASLGTRSAAHIRSGTASCSFHHTVIGLSPSHRSNAKGPQ